MAFSDLALKAASESAVIAAHKNLAKISLFAKNFSELQGVPGKSIAVPVYDLSAAAAFTADNNYGTGGNEIGGELITLDQHLVKSVSITDVEEAETVTFHHIGHLFEFHTKADIGLVGAVEAHGVVPGHAGELIELNALHLLEEVLGQTFEHVEHILLMDKAHLAVDLRELRLTVGTQVLVAEAAHNLEVAVHAGHHQQLLVLLRTLRQGVELAGIHAAGDDKVAGSLGGALYEHGGLNLQKIAVAKVVAYLHSHPVTHHEVVLHGVAADVEVAVLHAEVVAAVALVLDGEGRRFGLIEDCEGSHLYLYFSRWYF